ncbi:hypothetical protein Ddye_021900 [Dipteronia dyeriana]|uniref:glycerophosphodiester phosphodiesterase n=1 Tax=Dipteronia dyeriana TaxID=168575 RepID=A0AAD9U3J8_9ROSI|nr:hypothetical protein Ddye_021900 [Dipteronia dyeriana]
MTRCLLFISLLIHATLAAKGGKKAEEGSTKKWMTLNGAEPVVIARGGFSGLFPESSGFANKMGIATSLPNTILFCNLQLSKDGVGICQTDIRLDNSTTIAMFYPKGQTTYKVNGQNIKGWFAMDYTAEQLLSNVSLTQNVFSRPNMFDGLLPMSTVEDVTGIKPPRFWLNVQYDTFYKEHKLSMQGYIESTMKFGAINYISSPEIGFLKSMSGKAGRAAKTKLVFEFQDPNVVEPTTNKTYSEILKNLNTIKSFASGILVPKNYIWPVNNKTKYLDPPTTLVADAHKLGLEVYASGFMNDMPASYNYSYDPSAEYLQFIDNSQFAVDGFLTDFPPTASEAISCFALNKNTKPTKGKALIITNNGASGVYPGSTDLAYQQAINDGADVIDCSVQMSKDGVAFCLDTPDLIGKTNAMTTFMSRSTTVPEIQPKNGIFSFDLSWSEIQTLKPEMLSPFGGDGFPRNPAAKNQGRFVTLDGFLELAKSKGVSGILIDIENAGYLASKKGLDIVDSVTKALNNATFDKQSTQQVLIQSDDSSVLSEFSYVKTYKRVLRLEKEVSNAPKKPLDEIKKHANAVVVSRRSIVTDKEGFTLAYTNVVKELHSSNISVYVSVLRNEFITFAFDYFSDPILEIATYVAGAGVDGIITQFPATATRYMRSPCSDMNADLPYPILPAEPGGLLSLVPEEVQPPATAPAPALAVADILDPPLPPVADVSTSSNPPSASGPPGAPAGSKPSNGIANFADIGLSLASIMALCLMSAGC